MIVLSTMYTKKYGHTLNKEFNLSNLFPKDNKDSHEKYKKKIDSNIEQDSTKVQSTIQRDIEAIDITGISSVKLRFLNEEKAVQVRSDNLVKIAKLIANTYKKTDFKPWELQKAYTMIEADYKSSLSPAQYKKIRDLVKKFVDQGGSIEFVK